MQRQHCLQSSFPEDVAIKIASSLEVSDLCSLGTCSTFWRKVCDSDFIWKPICKERWPALALDKEPSASQSQSRDLDQEKESNFKGWKEFYIKKHHELKDRVASFGECFSHEPINIDVYLKAIEDMKAMQFGFKDIHKLFLKPDINVLLNLIGLHYCIRHLDMQVDTLKEVIADCKIQEREVSIELCKRRRGIQYRFSCPNELHVYSFNLDYLTNKEEEEEDVIAMLDRGVTHHSVLRVQIYAAKYPDE